MKRFKLKKGEAAVYPVTSKEAFEQLTGRERPYVVKDKTENQKAFGLCPACENPVQLIGLYKRIRNDAMQPYAKHYRWTGKPRPGLPSGMTIVKVYGKPETPSTSGTRERSSQYHNRDAEIAKHNEYTYKFCPYASHIYTSQTYETKTEVSELEYNIYCILRENFDAAVYLMQQISGLYLSKAEIQDLLRDYIVNDGHLYYGATIYNLPWMLLYIYTMPAKPCFGRIVKKGSFLYNAFQQVPDIGYEDCDYLPQYVRVKGKGGVFLDRNFAFVKHKRTVVNDEVSESMALTISKKVWIDAKFDIQFAKLKNNQLSINETRFPHLLASAQMLTYRKTERSQMLLGMAKEQMPDIEQPQR